MPGIVRPVRVHRPDDLARRLLNSPADRAGEPLLRPSDEADGRVPAEGLLDAVGGPVGARVVHDDHLGVGARRAEGGPNGSDEIDDMTGLAEGGEDDRGLHREAQRIA